MEETYREPYEKKYIYYYAIWEWMALLCRLVMVADIAILAGGVFATEQGQTLAGEFTPLYLLPFLIAVVLRLVLQIMARMASAQGGFSEQKKNALSAGLFSFSAAVLTLFVAVVYFDWRLAVLLLFETLLIPFITITVRSIGKRITGERISTDVSSFVVCVLSCLFAAVPWAVLCYLYANGSLDFSESTAVFFLIAEWMVAAYRFFFGMFVTAQKPAAGKNNETTDDQPEENKKKPLFVLAALMRLANEKTPQLLLSACFELIASLCLIFLPIRTANLLARGVSGRSGTLGLLALAALAGLYFYVAETFGKATGAQVANNVKKRVLTVLYAQANRRAASKDKDKEKDDEKRGFRERFAHLPADMNVLKTFYGETIKKILAVLVIVIFLIVYGGICFGYTAVVVLLLFLLTMAFVLPFLASRFAVLLPYYDCIADFVSGLFTFALFSVQLLSAADVMKAAGNISASDAVMALVFLMSSALLFTANGTMIFLSLRETSTAGARVLTLARQAADIPKPDDKTPPPILR